MGRLSFGGVLAVALVMTTTLVGPALGQREEARVERILREAERDYALRANPELGLGERALIDYGVLVNFSFLMVDDSAQNTHVLRQSDVQAYAHVSLDGVHEFFGRLRYTYRDFNAGDAFDNAGDEYVYPLYDRAWYKFDLQRAIAAYEGRNIDDNFTLKVGRQFITWASGLTFSEQLYAVDMHAELAGPDLVLRGLVGRTPSSSVIDFDASRPSFDGDTERLYIGGKVTYTGFQRHDPYFFVLTQRDQNNEDFFILNPTPPGYPTSFEYNSTYLGWGSTGRLPIKNLSYAAEFVFETGRSRSTPYIQPGLIPASQTIDRIEAWAARLFLRYRFDDAADTELRFESVFASGDSDRDTDTSTTFGGNQRDTKDRAFNSLDGIGTGLAFGPPVSNLMMFRGGISSFPFRGIETFEKFRLGMDVYVFNKMDERAPLDEPTGNTGYLGTEVDLAADWRVTSDVSMHMRYGVFFPGAAIENDKDERHFFYTGITYSF